MSVGWLIVEFVAALAGAVVTATFVEYAVHRAMHWGFLYGPGHRRHHQSNDPRTFAHDLLDYGVPALALCWPLLLVSVPAGLGWMAGLLLYALLAAYSHQLQHADAGLVFWMASPVHHLHHVHDMSGQNFGVLVDWWDRLFHTYAETGPSAPVKNHTWHAYFAIPWR